MHFLRDAIKNCFPFEDMFDEIEKSIGRINELESEDMNKSDPTEFEDMRESQYVNLLNIYLELYLDPRNTDTDPEEVMGPLVSKLAPSFIEKVKNFREKFKIEDTTSYKMSELKYLVMYMQSFKNEFTKYMKKINDATLSKKKKGSMTLSKHFAGAVDLDKYQKINVLINQTEILHKDLVDQLEQSENIEIQGFLKVSKATSLEMMSFGSSSTRLFTSSKTPSAWSHTTILKHGKLTPDQSQIIKNRGS